ncbi:MAG: DMT family transporter [Oscillospiraceae bacterium]|nr:DMT family transporter [Oscillospiraceae bacterium]
MKEKNAKKAAVCAVLAALVWGLAFAFQRMATEYLGPFSFQLGRSIPAALCLGVLAALRAKAGAVPCQPGGEKKMVLGAVICGALLFAASYCQQAGLATTTAGMAGFLTAIYIVLVPVIAAVFLRRKLALPVWLGVALAALGLYFISVAPGSFHIGRGDTLVICCALLFAFHILTVERFIPGNDPVVFSCIQFWTCAALNLVGMMISGENPGPEDFRLCLGSILYVGVVSGAVGYTLQIAAQKAGNTVGVSLLLSLECVFSLLGGALLLGERLSLRQGVGCALIFAAVTLTQLFAGGEEETKHSADPAD